jgi:hypothetical protein
MTAVKKRLSMTPNQLVASNVAAQRRLKRWTQQETCDRLEPLLGLRWSPAVLSAAERSAEGQQRRREFSADEIVAFSRLFGIPVGAFLQPPEGIEFQVPDKRRGLSPDEIAAVVEGTERAEVRRHAQAIASRTLTAVYLATMKKIEGAAMEDIDLDRALILGEREQ